jgi:SpoVK/Ycf46/Vps4 family AAA+-type ATPase
MDSAREVEVLIRAKYPIIYITSWEERRIEKALQTVCSNLNRTLHVWTLTLGMSPPIPRPPGAGAAGTLPGELEALAEAHEAPEYTVFLLKDFHAFLKDNRVIRVLRDLSLRLRSRAQTLVILAPTLTLPTELEKDVTVLDYAMPDKDDLGATLDSALKAIVGTPGVETSVTPEQREALIQSAQGLTLEEFESVLARSLVEKKRLDTEEILHEKEQIIRKSGILEYYPADSKLGDVGGMELLKQWLDERDTSFSAKARAFGLPAPKGILLLGVQGCGKSLLSKAVAAHWNLPILRLDVGRIFGSLVGQSEDNIRRAISVSESVAPCVLWADELEKGFGGVGGSGVADGGTSARVFATFLTWMQEKTSPVFLVATANDVSALPPEMLRKGRFDEIFFIDLPSESERKDIWGIHLAKRGRDVTKFDLDALAKESNGFSGAEIEQAVVGALYKAFAANRDVIQEDLMNQAHILVPLSVMMKEDIDRLRAWAAPRTRPASKSVPDVQKSPLNL